jgi:hippurate hydrolase
MDALPIDEQNSKPYRSRTQGQMHACGHDGHTAILIATASYLSRHREFPGRIVLIFQPAEEGGFGARDMLDSGLLETSGITEIFGLHNLPGLPVGRYSTRIGPLLAASDRFEIKIVGDSTHAATPHLGVDAIEAGATLTNRINTIVSRQLDPLSQSVISLGTFNAGNAHNVIPGSAKLTGTVRTFSTSVQSDIQAALKRMCAAVASETGAQVDLNYRLGHPVTENHKSSVDKLRRAAEKAGLTIEDAPLHLFSEDFSFMLQACPGAFLFTGNGASASLHNAAYDFNDEAIIAGVKLWLTLVNSR